MLKELSQIPNTVIAVHPISIDNVRKLGIKDIFEINPHLSMEQWEKILIDKKISKVLGTISSKYLDLSNANLFLAAKKMNLESIGWFDHWKGFERLLKGSKLIYHPDKICVIDNFCKDRLMKLGFDEEKIIIVGHPVLFLRKVNQLGSFSKAGSPMKICIISQPDVQSKKFKSVFAIDNFYLLELIIKSITFSYPESIIRYRPHPKESLSYNGLPFDKLLWDESINFFDIFIGVNSINLIESLLYKKNTIFLEPRYYKIQDKEFPLEFRTISSPSELLLEIEKCKASHFNYKKIEKMILPTNRFQSTLLSFMSF
jgi:hypothetical protein